MSDEERQVPKELLGTITKFRICSLVLMHHTYMVSTCVEGQITKYSFHSTVSK